ncbi:MAG TPA: FAD-binding protein, partial [Acidimicrobiales bacterium]|nr:FAD-binding protein [Acidimicrobiales bacterium]
MSNLGPNTGTSAGAVSGARRHDGWDEEVDVVVAGSGGAALTGAYVAASSGLATVVVESTDRFGGTTAYSGAGLWLPANDAERRAGVDDSAELARAYYRATVGQRTAASLQDAFIDNAAPLVALLEQDPVLQFEWRPFPDYFSDRPGGLAQGRNVFPLDLPMEELGSLVETMRPPAPD